MTQQGTDTKVEETKEPTQQKVEPTEKTRTEDEYKVAVSTGVSKGLESITTQLNLRDTAIKSAESNAKQYKAESATRQAKLDVLNKEITAALSEDPERRDAYMSRVAILEGEQKLAEREATANAKLEDAEKLAWLGAMALKSIELKGKFQVPQEVLDTCVTEEQMDTIAKAFPEVKAAEDEKKTTFDSISSSTTGVDISAMSPTEKIAYALAHSKNK